MLHVLIESDTSYLSPKAHISHLVAPPFLFALTVIYRKLHIIIGTTSPILVTPATPYPDRYMYTHIEESNMNATSITKLKTLISVL